MSEEMTTIEQLKESKSSACNAIGTVLLTYGTKLSAEDFRRMAEVFNNLASSMEELVEVVESVDEQSKSTESVEGD